MTSSCCLFLLVTLMALTVVQGHHMRIVHPQTLSNLFKEKYHAGNVPFSIANYGDVPYGKTISGQIGLPSVLEDCVFEELPESQKSKSILLVERNECSFTQKSINVQKEGGKLAIIMDNTKNEAPGSIIMVDDGRGSQVHIPTILISYEDGLEILKVLQRETNRTSVALSIEFQLLKKEKSDLTLWLDIAEHQDFIFLRNLLPYYEKIKEHVNLQVAYPTRYCPSCQSSDCYYNGSYCRSDFKYYQIQNKGQLIIEEQLRQYYLFERSPSKWWSYMLKYDDVCYDLSMVEGCSEKIMNSIGISYMKINEKMKASFGGTDNQVLRSFSQEKYNSSIVYYPSVVINNIIYRGNLEPFQVYEVICESLKSEPQGCSGYVTPQKSSLSTWIVVVVVLSIFFGLFLVICYRRMARRELSEKISTQVNQLVNQYITMYEHDRYTQAQEVPRRQGGAS